MPFTPRGQCPISPTYPPDISAKSVVSYLSTLEAARRWWAGSDSGLVDPLNDNVYTMGAPVA